MEKSESNALTARWLCVCVCVYVKGCFCCCCLVTKLCPILCNPMDCSLPGSSVHGVSQARILEWVVMPSSTGSSQPRDRAHVSWLAGGSFITEPPGKSVLRALKGSIMLWEGSWHWHSGYFELTLRNSFWASRLKEILEYLWNKLILKSSSGWKIDSKCVYFLTNLAFVCEAGPPSVVSRASLSVWVSSLPTGLCLPSLTPGRNVLFTFAFSYSLPEPPSRRKEKESDYKESCNHLSKFHFNGWVILHCVYVPQLSYPFICWWTSRLLPCPGYHKHCCDEHWGTTTTLYARQQKRHRCIEQSFGLCGRGRGDDLGEWC